MVCPGRSRLLSSGAYSDTGYELRASFALFWVAIEYFAATDLQWLNLGAGAGVRNSKDGLTRFKRGWSNGTRTAYFCGRIFDRAKYLKVTRSKGLSRATIFLHTEAVSSPSCHLNSRLRSHINSAYEQKKPQNTGVKEDVY